MRKWLIAFVLGCCISFTSHNTAAASDYWVYAQDGCNYYVVTESLTTRKGAYEVDVKEVGPKGSCFKYGLGFYHNGKGIVYYRTPYQSGSQRMSNGHDLVAALWQYATTHAH